MEVSEILSKISKEYQNILGENLCGIYIHGSLAFGCFNWNKSDIDFMVVVYDELIQTQKEGLIATLLQLNQYAPPKGFEMSAVLYDDCKNFTYPTPFDLHFSNGHINKAEDNLSEYCRTMNGTDYDLAAHFTVIKEVGLVQYGKPISEVFGDIPKEDYLDSIKSDIEDAENEIVSNPVYIILNLCRVYAYMKEDLILSKLEGGRWGTIHLSEEYSELIQHALDAYLSNKKFIIDNAMIQEFAFYMKKNIFMSD